MNIASVQQERSWTVRGHEVTVEPVSMLGVLAVTVAGVLGIVLSPLSGSVLRTMDVWALADPSLLYLGLLLVPVVHVSVISTERFRWESLVSLLAVPGLVLGDAVALASVMVPLLVLISSYKARSVFNGKNYFWTYFRTGGTLIVILSLSLGAATGYTVYADDTVQNDMKDAVEDRAVEAAVMIAEQQMGDELEQMEDEMQDAEDALPDDINPQLMMALEQALQGVEQDIAHAATGDAQDHIHTSINDEFDPEQTQFVMDRFDDAYDHIVNVDGQYPDMILQRYVELQEGDGLDEDALDEAFQDVSPQIGEEVAQRTHEPVMGPVHGADIFSDDDRALLESVLDDLDTVTASTAADQGASAADEVIAQVDVPDNGEDGDGIPASPEEMIEQQASEMIAEPLDEAFSHPEHVAAVLFFLVFASVRILKLPVSIIAGMLGWCLHLIRTRL